MTDAPRQITQPNDAQFEKIAAFVLGDDLQVPEAALLHCSTLLIDTLGVAAGATGLAVGHIARDHAAEFHAAGSAANAATMLFDGRRVSLPGAAWALATQIDNLDGHDGYAPTKGHIGCAVVPALIAFSERHPDLTGPQALAALAMSYELSARAGIALHATVSDYHTSGAWNALGVASLGCRLEGATSDTLRHALGIAEYHGPRSQMMREIDNPTMLHDGSGMGALVGSKAALLAQRGFTGAPAVTVEAPQVAAHWQDLGQFWTVAENYIKPYPCCRWAHAAIDALHALMQSGVVTAQSVASIHVNTFDEAACLFADMPKTTTQAQYSMNFAIATMLKHGTIGPAHIQGAGLLDPDIATLIPKITASATKTHNARFPAGRFSDVEVVLTDGTRLNSGDTPARGGPDAWMPDTQVAEKFHTFCDGVLSPERTRSIWAMRDALLDPASRFTDLTQHLFAPGDV